MIHYGDITQISGYDVPIVDCVIGGSPCQDLSVAGQRAGLDGERSGLFMEQIRIIKEMRDRDARDGKAVELIRPRFMLWENVPGAFSSNKGEDFKIVLEETAKIIDKDAVIPMPPKNKWATSGCIMGDGWSIAWRILDAQFWGVPQRRRRIALVADFGGECAAEILFVRKGLRGDSEKSRTERKSPSTDAQGGTSVYDRDGECYGFPLGFRPENVRVYKEKATTLCVGTRAGFCNGVISIENHPADIRVKIDDSGKVQTLTSRMGTGGGNVPMAMVEGFDAYNQGKNAKFNIGIDENGVAFSHIAKGPSAVCYCLQGNQVDCADTSTCNGSGFKEGTSYTFNVRDKHCVAYSKEIKDFIKEYNAIVPHQQDQLQTADGIARSLVASTHGAASHHTKTVIYDKTKRTYIVRRLTPLECERLQGFPDLWTDIGEYTDSKGKKKKTSDSARYKALGNSIALPPWKWVLKRLCSHYERDATMASLFDGIGGFPCLWEQINGKGTAVWASEIEDFPVACTKTRIG